MARRPLTIDERKSRTRVLVFAGAVVVIVVLVVAAVAVFGSFLTRFGEG
jgi:ABC-type transporter Mla subunit MlaD